jgi:hypothetical protein|tara:strand:+ start:443 stop:655 length:213 start_codon:yes stop_codon:yes gene_type:complete
LNDKITLFQYTIYLTPYNTVEVESSILEQEDWDTAMEELEEYQEAVTVSNFLAYLKNLMTSINNGVTTYF